MEMEKGGRERIEAFMTGSLGHSGVCFMLGRKKKIRFDRYCVWHITCSSGERGIQLATSPAKPQQAGERAGEGWGVVWQADKDVSLKKNPEV